MAACVRGEVIVFGKSIKAYRTINLQDPFME